jgi:hypothetical protein
MQCQEIRQQIAIYRELDPVAQERVREHLAACSDCAAVWEAYQGQDRLLTGLPAISPSPALAASVRSRTVERSRRPARRRSWGWASAALSLALLVLATWGTLTASADALPGDALYPVKRGAEQVRLALTLDAAARSELRHRLAETRWEEVRQVLRQRRQARVEFQGQLQEVGDGVWLVDGLEVQVPSGAWSGEAPPLGSTVVVLAQAADGQLQAREVHLHSPLLPTPSPTASPTVSPSATPASTPTPAGAPTGTPTGAPTPRRGLGRRTDRPRAPAGPWPTDAEPSATVSAGDVEPPSATLTATGSPPQPWATPTASRAVPRPSLTVTPRRTRPLASATPGAEGPGPRPSVTPIRDRPGPEPSATPVADVPTPQPSATPRSDATPARPGATRTSRFAPGPNATRSPGRGGSSTG